MGAIKTDCIYITHALIKDVIDINKETLCAPFNRYYFYSVSSTALEDPLVKSWSGAGVLQTAVRLSPGLSLGNKNKF